MKINKNNFCINELIHIFIKQIDMYKSYLFYILEELYVQFYFVVTNIFFHSNNMTSYLISNKGHKIFHLNYLD